MNSIKITVKVDTG